MNQDQWQVCAVCGYPLERLGDDWLHSRETMQDHVSVPVDAGTHLERISQRCDCCDADKITHIALAHDFDFPPVHQLPQRSIGHWALCAECAELIRRRRWSGLVSRVRASAPVGKMVPPRWYLEDLYARLDRHMIEMVTWEEWVRRGQIGPVP